jgi:hypothetical protein
MFKKIKLKASVNTTITAKEFLIIFFPIVLIFGFVSIFVKCGTHKDYFERYLKNDSYQGIIIKKYKDKTRHEASYIVLKKEEILFEIDSDNWLYLWDLCDVGYYIKKSKGNQHLQLIRHNYTDTLFINYDQDRGGIIFMNRFE